MDHHHHPPAALAGAIIAHYLRNLTIAQGKRWTPSNDRDMQRLTELLDELGISGESIPAFTAERTTVAFEKPAETDPAVSDRRLRARKSRAGLTTNTACRVAVSRCRREHRLARARFNDV
mgnify:CR=1 FL=1